MNPRGSLVESLFKELQGSGNPGLAVGIYHQGHVVYLRGYGYANLEDQIAISPQTVFHAASVSKQFTAFAIALLSRDRRVDLESDVRDFLPYVPAFGRPITIRQLICHTSGLRDQWALFDLGGQGLDNRLRQQQILSMVSRQRALNFPPGSEFLYCNTGYTLLAEIVQTVSGMSLRKFCAERIFEPLGMTSTFFNDDVTEIVPSRARSYEPRREGGWRRALLNYDTVGATSLFTTAEDMLKWGANFKHPRVGDADLIKQISTSGTLSDGTSLNYGFALMRRRYAGREALLHFGGDAGFRSVFAYFAEHDLSIAMFANYPAADVDRWMHALVDIYLNNGSLRSYVPTTVPTEQAVVHELVGSYAGEFDPLVTLECAGEHVTCRIGAGESKSVTFRADGSFDLGNGTRAASYYRALRNERDVVVALEAHLLMAGTRVYPRVDVASPALTALGRLAGDYRCPELDITYTFSIEEGRLTARSLWSQQSIMFTPCSMDRFDSDHHAMSIVQFMRDSKGNATRLRVHGGRIRHVLFERVKADICVAQ